MGSADKRSTRGNRARVNDVGVIDAIGKYLSVVFEERGASIEGDGDASRDGGGSGAIEGQRCAGVNREASLQQGVPGPVERNSLTSAGGIECSATGRDRQVSGEGYGVGGGVEGPAGHDQSTAVSKVVVVGD